ncbi:MAG: DNA repair protein RecO [Defluviitaleaceae bacterium]|nr:DNA repair protein RecO [Defluviitaleaceae bacterium]
MKTIKARGLVIREFEAGEADKRLLLLCKEHGRIMAYARGARKPKSKFMAAAQLFTYSDFILAQGKGFFSVAQADVIESFYNLRTDYDRLCAAHLVAEVCEKTLWNSQGCDDLLLLMLKSLSNLAKEKTPPMQVTGVFLMRFFAYHGFRPQTDFCTVCNAPLSAIAESGEGIFFGAEGLHCAKHHIEISNCIKISHSAAMALSYILSSGLKEAFKFNAHPAVLTELQQVAKLLWQIHFETAWPFNHS